MPTRDSMHHSLHHMHWEVSELMVPCPLSLPPSCCMLSVNKGHRGMPAPLVKSSIQVESSEPLHDWIAKQRQGDCPGGFVLATT